MTPSSKTNLLVVGIGEVLWDLLPDGKKIGGAPANFAYHVSQFGLRGCVVSAIGFDALGDEIISDFAAKGLNSELQRVDYPTGTVKVKLNADGIPAYDITEHVAWDNIPFTATLRDLARRTKAVCFGSLARRCPVSRETIAEFLDSIDPANDPLIVFDINLRQHYYSRELIIDSLQRCNILKINDEELEIISDLLSLPGESVSDRCKFLVKAYGLHILILTCGTNGSYVFTLDGYFFRPTPVVEVADTVGAGDSFTATFIASLLRGDSIEQAHERATLVSAYVCTRNGAMPLLPEELTAGLQQ